MLPLDGRGEPPHTRGVQGETPHTAATPAPSSSLSSGRGRPAADADHSRRVQWTRKWGAPDEWKVDE